MVITKMTTKIRPTKIWVTFVMIKNMPPLLILSSELQDEFGGVLIDKS